MVAPSAFRSAGWLGLLLVLVVVSGGACSARLTPIEQRQRALSDLEDVLTSRAETPVQAERRLVIARDLSRHLGRWIDEVQIFYLELERQNCNPDAPRGAFDALVDGHDARRTEMRDRALAALDRLKLELDAKTWSAASKSLSRALQASMLEASTDLFHRGARERIEQLVPDPVRLHAALNVVDRARRAVQHYEARLAAEVGRFEDLVLDQGTTTDELRADGLAELDAERLATLRQIVALRFELVAQLIDSEWRLVFPLPEARVEAEPLNDGRDG